MPALRRDGTELFYVAPDRTLMAVPVRPGSVFEAGTVTRLFELRGSAYSVTRDGRRFVSNEPIGAASSRPITVVLNWTAGLKK